MTIINIAIYQRMNYFIQVISEVLKLEMTYQGCHKDSDSSEMLLVAEQTSGHLESADPQFWEELGCS